MVDTWSVDESLAITSATMLIAACGMTAAATLPERNLRYEK